MNLLWSGRASESNEMILNGITHGKKQLQSLFKAFKCIFQKCNAIQFKRAFSDQHLNSDIFICE